MSTLTLGHPRTASGRVERWLAVGALVLAQVAALAFGLAPVPASATPIVVPRAVAEAGLTLSGSTYQGSNLIDMYSYDWYDRQTGDVNGRASVSDEVNPIVPQFLLCVDLPYGCTGGGVLAEVDERAGTLKVRARSLADVGVPLEVGRNRALGNIGRANAVIDDVITLSAPATLTLRGHLAGSVERSLDYRPDVEFGASANFWRWREDLTNTEEPWIRENVGGYANGLNSSGTIDELFIVPVELPAGETNFSAFMKAYTYALSGASRTSETEFESSSMYASVRFDNTFGFEILVPAGVVATSASGLLPFTQDTTGQVPEPSALALLGLGLAGLAAARRRRQ